LTRVRMQTAESHFSISSWRRTARNHTSERVCKQALGNNIIHPDRSS
jgi:hypothetical protein